MVAPENRTKKNRRSNGSQKAPQRSYLRFPATCRSSSSCKNGAFFSQSFFEFSSCPSLRQNPPYLVSRFLDSLQKACPGGVYGSKHRSWQGINPLLLHCFTSFVPSSIMFSSTHGAIAKAAPKRKGNNKRATLLAAKTIPKTSGLGLPLPCWGYSLRTQVKKTWGYRGYQSNTVNSLKMEN